MCISHWKFDIKYEIRGQLSYPIITVIVTIIISSLIKLETIVLGEDLKFTLRVERVDFLIDKFSGQYDCCCQ